MEQKFTIKIPDGSNIQFSHDSSFENFIGQFQSHCSKILCVINGNNLRYYDTISEPIRNIRFDHKQQRRNFTEYYFRHIEDGNWYCVFGRESARLFYPRIDEVDPAGIHESDIQIKKTNFTPYMKEFIHHPEPLHHSEITTHSERKPNIIEPIHNTHNIMDKITIKHSHMPHKITILDKGRKLTFPNSNYSVEIETFYSS